MMDSGDNRFKGNAIIDWAIEFAPFAGDTL